MSKSSLKPMEAMRRLAVGYRGQMPATDRKRASKSRSGKFESTLNGLLRASAA
jgi:hypothetical protein